MAHGRQVGGCADERSNWGGWSSARRGNDRPRARQKPRDRLVSPSSCGRRSVFCHHRAMSTSSPVRLVLFNIDRTLVDHDGATAAGVEQGLVARSWGPPPITAMQGQTTDEAPTKRLTQNDLR